MSGVARDSANMPRALLVDTSGRLLLGEGSTSLPQYSRIQDGNGTGLAEVNSRNHLEVEPPSYDPIAMADRVVEVDPFWALDVGDVIADITNGADGTYTYYVSAEHLSEAALQLILSGGSGTVTVTVEGTLQDDGTAPASCAYIDVSTALYGSANWTASDVLLDSGRVAGQFYYFKIQVVAATGAADDADWTIYRRTKK